MPQDKNKKLNIFVHRASECLTDHESHGDGLICFSLLNGLAERGHRIYAYTNRAPIRACHPNIQLKTGWHRVPANSLSPWEYSWRAERWLAQIERNTKIDLIWRMHPYGASLPYPPKTGGRPLVIGPLFYGWPDISTNHSEQKKPRMKIGIKSLVTPVAQRGWENALRRAALLICATEPHAASMRQEVTGANVLTLPVIVEPPADKRATIRQRAGAQELKLLFVANLVAYKNPQVFCEMIGLLRAQGLNVSGTLVGDGPERGSLQAYCQANNLQDAICFAGKVSNTEVYHRLQEADALVSLSQGEPYGRSIVEAMSVGTPAICHRSGGPADFITDGVNSLLVDVLTPAAYAQTVRRLFDTQGLWETLSHNAFHASQEWRSEIVLTRLEKALWDVCSARPHRD